MKNPAIIKTIYLQAGPETVWGYLTKPDRLARWFHESDVELSDGADYKLLRDNPSDQGPVMCWGKVLEADKPSRLVYTFTHKWINEVETRVEWDLVPLHGGTQLTMTHTGFENLEDGKFAELSDHDKGWDEGFIRLRRVAATY